MERDWLVFDVNFLMWREFHAAGAGDPLRTALGVIQDLGSYADRFQTTHMVFAFDRGPYLRAQELPGYKADRHTHDPNNPGDVAKAALREMIDRVRTDMLPALGFGNVYSKPGYEADDIIAGVVYGLPDGDRAIMVSSDRDLYQLLSRRAALYNPVTKRFYTARDFKKEYGVPPDCWDCVKAVAGCSTDEIPGLDGVGEASALNYLKVGGGTGKRAEAIRAFMQGEDYLRNLRLVKLPYRGLRPITPEPDPPQSPGAFAALCERYGAAGAAPNGDRYVGD